MTSRKKILLLGSTGSIGTRTLDLIADFPDEFELVGVSAHSNIGQLHAQVRQFGVLNVCVSDPNSAQAFLQEPPPNTTVFTGGEGLVQLVDETDCDIIVVATVGFAGLRPTIRAIELGRTIALANKEVLVVAGDIVMQLARKHKVAILPIDSEHNAIFQCLRGIRTASEIDKLILTASGGPFREYTPAQMANITVAQALDHPTWNMGRKITIDSATMMNKGLEVIEAMHLFGVPVSNIEVLIHPQSTVHSMVAFIDGSVIAQLGPTDMYLPIQYALTYPERRTNTIPKLDFAQLANLTFSAPNHKIFPCLALAYRAVQIGGLAPTVLNAANEIAVERFLAGDIAFSQIAQIVQCALERTPTEPANDLNAILETDRIIRRWTLSA